VSAAVWLTPEPDPLAEAVVPESVVHARTSRLIAQVAGSALSGTGVETAERLGLRWTDDGVSAPDFFVMPGGAIGWDTTSYRPDVDGPRPLVAVEVITTSWPDPTALVRRGITTYLVYPERHEVWRFDAATSTTMPQPLGAPCPELGGIAFVAATDHGGTTRLGVADVDGNVWLDPDEHVATLADGRRAAEQAQHAAEQAQHAAEQAQHAAERRADALAAELAAARAELGRFRSG
jgi:hypothetical protein